MTQKDRAEKGTQPVDLSVVISTIGRDDQLARLVASLEPMCAEFAIELVLVDQSDDLHVTEALRSMDTGALQIVTTTSPRGVSRGRNAGIEMCSGAVIAFPDDDVWFAPDCITRVFAHLDEAPGLAGISARQATADGSDSMLRWWPSQTLVTRQNWSRTTIASGLFIRRSAMQVVGTFLPEIGTGSGGPIGAGEETDLVLRILAAGGDILYDPQAVVYQDDPRDSIDPSYIQKMRGYGRGQGFLYARHQLPMALVVPATLRKAAGVVVHQARGRHVEARSSLEFLRGTYEGWLVERRDNDR